MSESARLLVFDVGGSHVAGALCDVADLRLSAAESAPLDANGTEESFYSTLRALGSKIVQRAGVRLSDIQGSSLAFPGPFDYDEGVSLVQHKFASLYGKNLRAAIADRFKLPAQSVQFVNDADAFLLGELSQNIHAVAGRTLGVTLGTGVGSAFAIDGTIVHRGKGVPLQGEIWNLPWNGGILEDAISTRAIRSAYEKQTRKLLSVREIAAGCPADADATIVFRKFGTTLGNALHSVAAEFQPASIIFGGAISRSAELFLLEAQARLGDSVRLLVSSLFEDAALLGAAVHWERTLRNNTN